MIIQCMINALLDKLIGQTFGRQPSRRVQENHMHYDVYALPIPCLYSRCITAYVTHAQFDNSANDDHR